MAYEIGTANNLEDMFDKMVSFLTTNPTLVTANQNWSVVRLRKDNLLSATSPINFIDNFSGARDLPQIMREDSRTLNTDSTTGQTATLESTNFTNGQHIDMVLRVAKAVKFIKLKLGQTSSFPSISAFRLQHSDDGAAWTTAVTHSAIPTWVALEERTFSVPDGVGDHTRWRIIFDTVTGSNELYLQKLCLLTASGEYANHFGSEVILKAEGLNGNDEIYTGIRTEASEKGGWYNLFLNGYTGFDPTVQSWFRHPGAIPNTDGTGRHVPMVPLWDTTMPYWFVANGRSFRFAVKVSTNCEGGYLGYILPYASPSQYAYPLVVGGSLVPNPSIRNSAWRYSHVGFTHGVYPGPGGDANPILNTDNKGATLYLRNLDGFWSPVSNRPRTDSSESVMGFDGTTQSWRGVWPHCQVEMPGQLPYRECLGGGYIIQDCIILQRSPTPQVFGQLEGTYNISGFQNSFENTTIIDGKNYVILQNGYRNTVREFWALSLD
jgi:hypothetical protein